MTTSPLALARRHVLGELNGRCEPISDVPVFLTAVDGEQLGHADESLGHYADAVVFHLSEDVCKKLAAGHYTYSFNYEYADELDAQAPRRRVKLTSITLTARKAYAKPVPRRTGDTAAKAAAAAVAEAE